MDVLQFSRMCWNHLDVGSNPFQCSWLFEIWCNMGFHVASSSQLCRLKVGGNKSTIRIPVLGCFENLSLKIDMATQRWRFERCYFPYSIGWFFRFQPLILEEKKPKLPSPPPFMKDFRWEKKTRQKSPSSPWRHPRLQHWWSKWSDVVVRSSCDRPLPYLGRRCKMGSPHPRNNPGGDWCWVSGASQRKTRCVYKLHVELAYA